MLKYPTQRYPTFLPDMLQQQRFLDFSNKIEIVWPLGTCLQKVRKRVKTESVQEELKNCHLPRKPVQGIAY